MKVYKYKERNIIEFDDKTKLSLATKKYGKTLNQITNQALETGYKLGNAYNIINNDTVEILYWNKKDNIINKIYLDYEDWFKYKEVTITLNTNGYPWIWNTNNKREFLHRIVLNLDEGDYKKNKLVDHINGVRTDCRKINLRIVDFELNAKNQPYNNILNKSTGIRGISFTKNNKKYRVRWRVDGKEKSREFKLNELNEAIEFNKIIRKENNYIVRKGDNK